jgi:hypothetical protein
MIKTLLSAGLGLVMLADFAHAQTYSLRVQNLSEQALYYIYASSENDSNWGPDRLGSSVLEPDDAATILVESDSCFVDILIVDASGGESIVGAFNICDMGTLYVN